MSRQEGVLELRRRILQMVARFPGIHVRELARLLDRSQALTDYHVAALAESGLLRPERFEQYLRLYPAAADLPLGDEERRMLALLRDRRGLHIALFLLGRPPSTRHTDIARGTGMGKSLVSFHLNRLVEGGLLRHEGDGYALADWELVSRLMARHQPTPDLREEFADLWDALYD